MSSRALRVGELARRCGISVRALHHYDEIGLLRPTFRTESGHRLYGAEELRRLQRILSLRQLGFSLDDVQSLLEQPGFALRDVIERHRADLEARIAREQRLVQRLEEIAERLESCQELTLDELMRSVEETTMLSRYYSEEQLEELADRREEIGDARIREVENQWQEIFARLEVERSKGTDPAAPEVQAIAREAQALIAEFTGGDAGVTQSLATMYRKEGGAGVMAEKGWSVAPEVFAYLSEAMKGLAAG